MAIKKKVKRKGNVVSVDFTGVEAGGRPVPDGTWRCEIVSMEQEESSTGNPMIVAKYKVLNGKGKGGVIYDNLSLQPQALFRLKALCEAIGVEAESATDLDLDELVGQEVLIDVENETYEDKKRPRAAGYASSNDKDSEEDDSKEDDSEDEDEDDDDEDEETSEDEEEEDDDEKSSKKSSKSVKSSKRRAKDEDEDEDDEDEDDSDDADDDDEDDDEEERPTKRKPGKVGSKTSSGLVKGAKVKFKDGKTLIKGTVVSVKNKTARVEDRNGDEFDVPSEQVELL